MQTYEIEAHEDGTRAITCLVCGMKSYMIDDIKERYCGNCNQFHDVMESEKTPIKTLDEWDKIKGRRYGQNMGRRYS